MNDLLSLVNMWLPILLDVFVPVLGYYIYRTIDEYFKDEKERKVWKALYDDLYDVVVPGAVSKTDQIFTLPRKNNNGTKRSLTDEEKSQAFTMSRDSVNEQLGANKPLYEAVLTGGDPKALAERISTAIEDNVKLIREIEQ